MKQKDGRNRTAAAQHAIRELVVLNKKKQLTNASIAETLGISIRGVQKIWKAYQEKGTKGIAFRKRGRKSVKAITKEEGKKIQKMIQDKMPDQLKLPYALWTRSGVGELITKHFGVKVSKWTVGRYLKEWGFTPQKPIRKAYEQNPESVKQWLAKDYVKIKKKAKKEQAEIFWGDETGMRSDHQAGKSYSPKGVTPVVIKTGKRFKINMISAINNKGKLNFMIYHKGFNTTVFIKFMSRLIERAPCKILFIVDGHPSHKTIAVKEWIEKHKTQIELFYLPSYSPELNPDEYLNQDIKTNVLGKKKHINKEQLYKNVTSFLKKKQHNPEQIAAYFRAKHVLYAA